MFDAKLNDRQKKYNDKLQGNHADDYLLRRREEHNLSLRKDKMFNKIMEKRLRGLNESKPSGFNFLLGHLNEHLEIEVDKLDIPKSLITNYEQHSEKLIVISKLLEENINQSPVDENFKKFAIHKFRKYLQEKKEEFSNFEIDLLNNSIYPAIEKIFLSSLPVKANTQSHEEFIKSIIESLRMKYEISWSLINLTNVLSIFVDKILKVNFLKNMESILEESILIEKDLKINA